MNALPFAFAYPAILGALVALPVIWWLLRLTPPRPKTEVFPPLKILASVLKREETPAKSPWWLTLLRMVLAATIILAIADPVFNPRTSSLASGGPLVLFVDNSWAAAPDWERRIQTADALIDDAESAGTPVSIAFTADPTNDAVPGTAAAARDKLRAAEPRPLVPDRERAFQALRTALNGIKPGTLAFLTDGAAAKADDATVRRLAELQPADLRLIEGDAARTVAITAANNAADAMTVKVTRLN
ncbi:BatA domain-containing protein, partial [Rhizobium ruizarguesonis]